MQNLPHGTVTFLFTDIERSTRLWQAHPEAMAAAYARHDITLRGAISAQGGVVYKVIGDAFQVAFPTAPSALAATLAAQRALQAESWPLPEPLRVRMALHTGAVDPEPDGDYRSPVLNRLGRLLAAGHGGQILLSDVTRGLTHDRLPPATTTRDLGKHQLKDLLEPEPIHQVVHPDLIADFPPLITLTIRSHNLPVQVTPFIGRDEEVATVAGLLRDPGVRLLTLTGPGGTGKTRLSLQAAADVVEHVPDGVWFVELAAVTDPELVPGAIAATLGIREEGSRTLQQELTEHLRDKRLLLVLDNLEQVLPAAAPGIGELIAAAPGLTVLVTSRGPLRLRAEREHQVQPLRLPRRKPPPTVAQLGQYEAVRLFIDRAQAVRPEFAVTNENAPAIAEICHRLDGLPLAIELAAARVRMLPPEAMLKRLTARLPLLTGGARDLPLRQQTLRGAIAWSYELLSEKEQALFRRLAVFAGGADLEAIDAVAAGDELGIDLFEGLERLVDHSLLRQTESAGEPRFRMLETIREYGLDRLQEHGETREARQRHASVFLDVAEAAVPALRGGPEQGPWLTRLETEHDNVRAALAWSIANAPETAVRLAGALGRFWYMRGYLGEGRRWLEDALAVGDDAPATARVLALNYAAVMTGLPSGSTVARAWLEEALVLARTIGDPGRLSMVLNNLAVLESNPGQGRDLVRAIALFDEALMLNRERGDLHGLAIHTLNLGITSGIQGDLDRAMRLMEESVGIARQLGDRFIETEAQLNLVQVAWTRNDIAKAGATLRDGLATAMDIGVGPALIADAVANAGMLANRAGHHGAAARLFGAAEAQVAAIGSRLEWMEPDAYAQAVAGARDCLGEAAFTAAWEAGGKLSLEEAVAEALAVVAK